MMMSRLASGCLRSMCALLLCVVWTSPTGCAFIRGSYGEELGTGDIGTIKKGVSTRADVAEILGAPDRIIVDEGLEVFQYFHYDMKSGLIIVFSRTNVKSDDTFIIFDKSGIVEEVISGKKKAPLEFQFWPFDWPFGP